MTSAPPLLDGRTKGLPAGTAPLTREAIAAAGWNVLAEDLPLPLAVLKESALAHNSAWMQAFRTMTGVEIAPHGKTSMSPELYARQLQDGAWGITVATVQQLRVCREHGIRRVLMANQLVGKQAIRYVLEELACERAGNKSGCVAFVHSGPEDDTGEPGIGAHARCIWDSSID